MQLGVQRAVGCVKCSVCSVHCVVIIVQLELCSVYHCVQYIVCNIQYWHVLCSVYCEVFSVQFLGLTIYCIMYFGRFGDCCSSVNTCKVKVEIFSLQGKVCSENHSA